MTFGEMNKLTEKFNVRRKIKNSRLRKRSLSAMKKEVLLLEVEPCTVQLYDAICEELEVA